MYLLYVDESGDIGLDNSPTNYFCLSGLVVHELRWDATLAAVVSFFSRSSKFGRPRVDID